MGEENGHKKLDVIRESPKVIHIGNGGKRKVDAKDIDEKDASDMQVFCLKCPRFMFSFKSYHRASMLDYGERMEGELMGICKKKDGDRRTPPYEGEPVSAVLQWIDSQKVDSYTGRYDFRPDNIPVSIKTQVEAFLKKAKCVRENCDDCNFYMERTLNDWNGEE